METAFLICAIVGGTLLACQFLLALVGAGSHYDIGDHDLHDVSVHEVAGHDQAMSWFMAP